ncbi:hypothetical protein SAMN05192552_1007116 [Natrinema hispanicum]|uniref:Uncharacterized protein n=1 Tax=Natrinema hispanicum TaxID=392421 RepID=A0A1I0FWB3_9EURY|nr:hypothetical protein SAMN05192552_1007116 [Natrinema hispanicum]SET61959.1 hypothetical protein SAMN04488694_10989 [Natrinema hispanicum]
MIYYAGDGQLTPVATDPTYEPYQSISTTNWNRSRGRVADYPVGSRTSALKHVTGHRSAHVSSGYHERCPSHMLPPLESHFGSTVGSTTRVCRDDLWHRIWHRSQRLDNRSRVAAPIASPWPSTLLSARLSVVPVRQQSSDVTGVCPAVARFRGVTLTSPDVAATPMDEGGVARLVVTSRILHSSPRRCGFEPV